MIAVTARTWSIVVLCAMPALCVLFGFLGWAAETRRIHHTHKRSPRRT